MAAFAEEGAKSKGISVRAERLGRDIIIKEQSSSEAAENSDITANERTGRQLMLPIGSELQYPRPYPIVYAVPQYRFLPHQQHLESISYDTVPYADSKLRFHPVPYSFQHPAVTMKDRVEPLEMLGDKQEKESNAPVRPPGEAQGRSKISRSDSSGSFYFLGGDNNDKAPSDSNSGSYILDGSSSSSESAGIRFSPVFCFFRFCG